MRRRLGLVALAVSSMVAIAFLVPLALLVREVARDNAIAAAERDVAAVAPVLAVASDPAAVTPAMERTASGADGRLGVRLPDGTVVGRPATTPGDITDRAGAVEVAGGVEILQPVAVAGGGVAVVSAFVPDAELTEGIDRAWLALVLVAVVLVAASVAVADRLARHVVQPTRGLAAAAAALGSGDLDVRVAPDGPPELVEVGHAFNHLAGQVSGLLAAERELVADVSHRLRTPLTALRIDVESLGPGDAADRVRADAMRVEAALTAVIEEARAGRQRGRCDAAEVVAERAAWWSALAEEQDRPWEIAVSPAGVVAVRPDDLAAALDALLGNVFAHTAPGVPVRIEARSMGNGVVIAVERPKPQAARSPSRTAGSVALAWSCASPAHLTIRQEWTGALTLRVECEPQ